MTSAYIDTEIYSIHKTVKFFTEKKADVLDVASLKHSLHEVNAK